MEILVLHARPPLICAHPQPICARPQPNAVVEISPFGRNDGMHNGEKGNRNGFAVSVTLLYSPYNAVIPYVERNPLQCRILFYRSSFSYWYDYSQIKIHRF
jgi:hypothetical protein